MHANELHPGSLGPLLPPVAPTPFTGEEAQDQPTGEPHLVDPAQVPAPAEIEAPPAPDCPGLSRLWEEEDSSDAASWSVDGGDQPVPAPPKEAEPWLEPELLLSDADLDTRAVAPDGPAEADVDALPASAVEILP